MATTRNRATRAGASDDDFRLVPPAAPSSQAHQPRMRQTTVQHQHVAGNRQRQTAVSEARRQAPQSGVGTPTSARNADAPAARGALRNPNAASDMKKAQKAQRKAEAKAYRNAAKAAGESEKSQAKRAGKAPLFKFEGDAGDTIVSGAIIAGGIALAAAVYATGVWTAQNWMLIAAFAIVILTVVVWIWRRRKSAAMTEAQISDEIERYRQDLVDTYTGYDVDYTSDDIEEQVEKYRDMLEEENASIAEISPSMMLAAARDSRKKTKALKEEAKALRKRQKSSK